LRDELSATAWRILAYFSAIAVIVVTLFSFVAIPQLLDLVIPDFATPEAEAANEPTRPERPERPDWITVERPFRAFALTIPELAQSEPDYAIRRHATGGGRKDVMTWGMGAGMGAGARNGAEAARSRLLIEIYRPGSEIDSFGDAHSEVAAQTELVGGPYALTEAAAIEGKFGATHTFDFTADLDQQPRQCLGFARAFEEPRLQIAGWYCRGALEVIDRGVLACALERLSLVMAASEPKVTALFANAERQRKPCGQKAGPAQRLSNTLRHDWLSTGSDPKLRGGVAAR